METSFMPRLMAAVTIGTVNRLVYPRAGTGTGAGVRMSVAAATAPTLPGSTDTTSVDDPLEPGQPRVQPTTVSLARRGSWGNQGSPMT